MSMLDLAGLDMDALSEALEPLGGRPYNARQLYRWLYARRVSDFASMTDLSLALRERLGREAKVAFPSVIERVTAGDETVRYVYALADGQRTESVWIPGPPDRRPPDGPARSARRVGDPSPRRESSAASGSLAERVTLCLSSQVGCALACRFCLSGVHGLKRHLSAGEIVGQAWTMLREAATLERVNVVFMGIGEPLDNYQSVMRAARLLSDPQGFAIPMRRITVSTAGHVPYIEKLALEPARPRLAVSLNATTNELRSQIMPINKAYPLERLLGTLRDFPLGRDERITFEYVLLGGLNDSDEDAGRLRGLLHGIPIKINLIPWNPSPGLPFETPSWERVERFKLLLEPMRAPVTVRRRRGGDASAACGQLSFKPRALGGVVASARAGS